MKNKVYADAIDTLVNIEARHVIQRILPVEADYVLQVYGLNKYQSLIDGEYRIDFSQYEEFCESMGLKSWTYTEFPLLDLAYHLTYPGYDSINDRWIKYCDQVQLSDIYCVEAGEMEPVIQMVVDMLSTQSEELKQLFYNRR